MRVLVVMLLSSAALLAQSMSELKQKYGTPVSETYAVRNGIGVTVKRGPNGAVTEMLIVPIRTDSLIGSRSMTLSDDAAKNVLDELVPLSVRGKFLMGSFVNAVCMPENDCAGSSGDYENVSIVYNAAARAGQLCYVDVRFKK